MTTSFTEDLRNQCTQEFWLLEVLVMYYFMRDSSRAEVFLCALSVLRSGRFAFCHDAAWFVIRRSAPSGAGAGRFMELRWSEAERRAEWSEFFPWRWRKACSAVLGGFWDKALRGWGQCGPASVGPRDRQAAQTERSGVRRSAGRGLMQVVIR